MARHAFTLLELLVVISIIALLVSMLLPAVALVRESAGKVSCGSRLRQMGMTVQMYANEHEGMMAPPGVAAMPAPEWDWPYGTIYQDTPFLGQYDEVISAYRGPYMHNGNYFGTATPNGHDSLFHCPRDPRRKDGTSFLNTSYGVNVRVTPVYAMGPGGEDAWTYNVRRLSQFKNPGDLAYAIDAGIERWDPGYGAQPTVPMIKASTLVSATGTWSGGSPEAYYDWTNWHRGGANILFLDGHVRSVANPAAESATKMSWFTPPP